MPLLEVVLLEDVPASRFELIRTVIYHAGKLYVGARGDNFHLQVIDRVRRQLDVRIDPQQAVGGFGWFQQGQLRGVNWTSHHVPGEARLRDEAARALEALLREQR